MNQLTVRGFGEELRSYLQKLAQSRGISLNKAALLLLRKGAGIDDPTGRPDAVGSSLDHLIGTWSEEQEKEFLADVESCERIDEAFWE